MLEQLRVVLAELHQRSLSKVVYLSHLLRQQRTEARAAEVEPKQQLGFEKILQETSPEIVSKFHLLLQQQTDPRVLRGEKRRGVLQEQRSHGHSVILPSFLAWLCEIFLFRGASADEPLGSLAQRQPTLLPLSQSWLAHLGSALLYCIHLE